MLCLSPLTTDYPLPQLLKGEHRHDQRYHEHLTLGRNGSCSEDALSDWRVHDSEQQTELEHNRPRDEPVAPVRRDGRSVRIAAEK